MRAFMSVSGDDHRRTVTAGIERREPFTNMSQSATAEWCAKESEREAGAILAETEPSTLAPRCCDTHGKPPLPYVGRLMPGGPYTDALAEALRNFVQMEG